MSDLPSLCRRTMGSKPVLWRGNTRTVRYLQYVTSGSAGWWAGMRTKGAVLLGADARKLGLCEPPARQSLTESETTAGPAASPASAS